MAEAKTNENDFANNLENMKILHNCDIGELLRLCDKRVNSRLHRKESILVLGKNLGAPQRKNLGFLVNYSTLCGKNGNCTSRRQCFSEGFLRKSTSLLSGTPSLYFPNLTESKIALNV